MVLKRQFKDREDETPSRGSKKGPKFLNLDSSDLLKGFPTNDFLTKFEPFLRSVVRDEVQRTIGCYHPHASLSLLDQFKPSQARTCELHFVGKIHPTIFTGNRVETKDEKPIKVVIRDSLSKKILTSSPLSSVKIEIVVLDGDFGSDDEQDWSEGEFEAKLVKEREGKKPLLIGDLRTTLKDGVGYVGEVAFTDNSSWIRSRKFRLGARVVQGTYDGATIREARSEAFGVKDQRGEGYKKHHPPTMEDELWRLEKIAKDGVFHRRLAGKGIRTVKEFTQLYHIDPTYLRNVLGGGISNKTWQTIIEHADECVVDGKMYTYSKDASVVLVFDAVYRVVGVLFDGQGYQSLNTLSVFQMGLVKSLKAQAYKNLSDWILLDDLSASGPAMPSSSLPDIHGSPSSGLDQVLPIMQQDQLEIQSIPNFMPQRPYVHDVQDNGLTEPNFFVDLYRGGDSSQIREDSFHFCESPWQANEFLACPSYGTTGISFPNFSVLSRSATPRGRWLMIKAALRWGITVRRDAAAKRNSNVFYRYGY